MFKLTKKENLFAQSDIVPPKIRRDVVADIKRTKVQVDYNLSMYNITPAKFRLKSKAKFKRTRKNLFKWGLPEDDKYECGRA